MKSKKPLIHLRDRVIVAGKCKSQGRKGIVTNYSPWEGLFTVHLAATSNKRACSIRITFAKLEKLS